MENKKSLQVLRHFFGLQNDTRPETFVEANYLGTRYEAGAGADSHHTLQILLNKNYTGAVAAGQENYLHENMVDLIINAAMFHRTIDPAGALARMTGATPGVNSILTNVYAVWDELSDSVRKFYMTHLYLLEQTTANVWIIPSDIKAAVAKIRSGDVRLNLTKVDSKNPASDVLFATTLPRLPASVNGFKYSSAAGVQTVQLAAHTPDFLKDLYMSVYRTGNMSPPVGGAAPAYRAALSAFSLDTEKFIQSTLAASGAPLGAPAAPVVAGPFADNFDDLYESLTTGVKYIKKSDGLLYRQEPGKSEVQFDINEVKEVARGCGTRTNAACDVSVYRCLLSGEPRNLSSCLNKLKDANMFNVAKKEVDEMSPKVALQLLKTFGFKVAYDPKLGKNAPPSFEHWVANVLPRSVDNAETLNAIRGNVQLMNYLNGVVNLIRGNTDLIDQKAVTPTGKTYASKAGVSYFVAPPSSGRSTVGPVVLQQGILTPRSSSLDLSLIQRLPNLFGSLRGLSLGNMMGGAHKDLCFNARALAQMFDTTYSEMERHGKVLVDADKQRINDAVKRVNHLEEQLMRINEDIKQFNKLHSIISAGQGLDEVNLKDVVNSRTQITADAISNLVSAATQNVNEQSRLGSDLVFQVQHAILRTLTGTGGNSLLSRVN
jgi:hypothetical protein